MHGHANVSRPLRQAPNTVSLVPMPAPLDHRFSVAPMLDWTDRHCRAFHRVLSRRALLYTEMVVDQALIHGDPERLLAFDPREKPLALQLGGSDPELLARAVRIAAAHDYDEFNLNVGCPSDRVQSGRFGACLMTEPQLVADCLAAMREASPVPVTVKHRLGIDDQDPEETLFGFVETLARAGVTTFIVHARKAWLQGLSPRENRERPPLDYDLVSRLKAAHPDLTIVLNGGLSDLDQAIDARRDLDGVMLGRAAYQTPWTLAEVDTRIFGEPADPCATRADAVQAMRPYVEDQLAAGHSLHAITRHMLGLYKGEPRARLWRQSLAQGAIKDGAGWTVVADALAAVTR